MEVWMMKWWTQIEIACVPISFILLIGYQLQLLYRMWKKPSSTVLGVNRQSREAWILHTIKDPAKHATVAVQALRNTMMASTVLATASISLGTLIGALITHQSNMGTQARGKLISSIQLISMLVCFMVSFLCNLQCLRYISHISFLVCVPGNESSPVGQTPSYLCQSFNRGMMFWSIGIRSFYFSIPLFMWLYGPLSFFLASLLTVLLLHYLDTVSTDETKHIARLGSINVKLMNKEPKHVEV